MSKRGYIPRSIQLPELVDDAVRELAAKHKRSVTAEIQLMVEAELARRGYQGQAGQPARVPMGAGA